MKEKNMDNIHINFMKFAAMIFACFLFVLSIEITCPTVVLGTHHGLPGGYEKVSDSHNLILYCEKTGGTIAIEDKRNGYVWKSVVSEDDYDFSSATAQWKTYMKSMVVITHYDMEKNQSTSTRSYSFSDTVEVNIEQTDIGVSITYSFTEPAINVTLEVELNDDCAVFRIPANKIEQNGLRGIISIEVMPFFGAAGRDVDGYMFYPDGSGALTKYKNAGERTLETREYVWNIYGLEKVDLDENLQREINQKHSAMLPVYGIKNQNNAILAAVTKGIEDTNIKVGPDGFAVKLNRIFFEFCYRRSYNIYLSNITVQGKSTSKNPVGSRFDKEMILKDREVRVFFLEGEKADYSGMANVYREYLIENNKIKKVVGDSDKIPLYLTFFMGTREERMLFDKFIPMTTFQDALYISEAFKTAGVDMMQVLLKGWTKGGYGNYPTNWPPDRRLGGISGLKKYTEYALENNIDVFVQNNFTLAFAQNGGFSTRRDVVMQGSNIPVTDMNKNRYLFNPFIALQRFVRFTEEIRGIDGLGIAADKIGSNIYHDYNTKNPSSRSETADKWVEMIKTAQSEGRSVAVEGGNQYVLSHADWLYNIPLGGSDFRITDEEVPFYQMVVHGIIPYISDPGNLSSNILDRKLKWVEYGCNPNFELTYQKAVNLKNTDYNRLFSSYFSDWLDTAAGIYKEFNQRLNGIWNRLIIDHTMVLNNLYKVSYDNGSTVYVNYNNEEVVFDGYKIKAKDYILVEKGGLVK